MEGSACVMRSELLAGTVSSPSSANQRKGNGDLWKPYAKQGEFPCAATR